jgi:hypothetical protein
MGMKVFRKRRVDEEPIIPSPIQCFLQCRMTAGAHFDQGFLVSNVGHS